MKKIIIFSILLTIVAIPILVWCVIWCASMAKCEVLTLKHGNEFSYGYKDDLCMPNEYAVTEYWKVIKYNEESADVYYIIKDNASGENTSWEGKYGDIYSFVKENGQWKGTYQKTLWSSIGTADEIIWPYWWHAGTGIIQFILYVIPLLILNLICSVCLYKAIRSHRRNKRATCEGN